MRGIGIVWRMLLPPSGHWFAVIRPDEARNRHGARWLAAVVPASIAAGAVIAISQGIG